MKTNNSTKVYNFFLKLILVLGMINLTLAFMYIVLFCFKLQSIYVLSFVINAIASFICLKTYMDKKDEK